VLLPILVGLSLSQYGGARWTFCIPGPTCQCVLTVDL
jgi:hypothetical protein